MYIGGSGWSIKAVEMGREGFRDSRLSYMAIKLLVEPLNTGLLRRTRALGVCPLA
jgi:hypothetical protein